jgi:intracellular multiplication protein IcmS
MDVKDQCIALSRVMGIDYGLKNRTLTYEEVFSYTGFLPQIAKRADQLSMICFGYGIGAQFVDFKKSTCGIKVEFDNIAPAGVRMICITDVLCELVTMSSVNGRTMLDELLYSE